MSNEAIPPVWAVAANIVTVRRFGPGGNEIKLGTKHFRPGTKVYIIDWYAGMCERITVVGRGRKSHRLIKIVLTVAAVENLRVKMVYEPAVLSKIKEHYPGNMDRLTKTSAETMCKIIPYWQAELNKNHADSELVKNKSSVQGFRFFVRKLFKFLKI